LRDQLFVLRCVCPKPGINSLHRDWQGIEGAKTIGSEQPVNVWGGLRVCVGRLFVYLEMKAILVELLSKFVFETVDRSPKMLNPTLSLKSAN
jgi:cytochrome P450